MSTTFFAHTAAAGATVIAIGFTGAITLPAAAGAATAHPAISRGAEPQPVKCHVIKERNPNWRPGDPPSARHVYEIFCGV